MSIFKNLYFRIGLISEASVLPYFVYNEMYQVPMFIACKWLVVLMYYPLEKLIKNKDRMQNNRN